MEESLTAHVTEELIDLPEPARRIFCNRTLNLRSIRAIGFDMDYTLIHYRTEQWERRAYEHVRSKLRLHGWPMDDVEFDPRLVMLGLVIDLHLGNIVKPNRFGFVKAASHGTRMLSFDECRDVYSRVVVDLAEPRWVFLNTLFGLSEGCMYAQTVDLLDQGKLEGVMGYADLYRVVRESLDETHMRDELKAEIVADPETFVELDDELPLALLDLKNAGKKLVLITNSEWAYTQSMMSYAFDGKLSPGMTWKDLFDVVIVGARKPSFFTQHNAVFEVLEGGFLRPFVDKLRPGGTYLGGHAGLVERCLGVPGEEILYLGDHIFADVHVSKNLLRWRTGLVVRELEAEMSALESFKSKQAQLTELMGLKERMEHHFSHLRLRLQRIELGYGAPPAAPEDTNGVCRELRARMQALREELVALDERIAPLAREAGELCNSRWGLLMRAGNDKSHLARQIERYADVYMSRVSNLLHLTPFVYLRSPRGSMPHDSGPSGGV